MYRMLTNEAPDYDLYAANAKEALNKVSSAFASWDSNGRPGDRPKFADGDYVRLRADHVDVVENERGYGLKAKLFAREDPEWWHVGGGEYQREYLEAITNEDADLGTVELHLDGDSLAAHANVTESVEVVEWTDVETRIGVDLGEVIMYAAVAVHEDDVVDVTMERGGEFRHHRERLKRKRERLSRRGEVRKVEQARNQYDDYTDHVTHRASKEIVDFARGFEDPGIRVEDLTHYRRTAEDPIHDWPFAKLQTKLAYKATDEGIPLEFVSPEGTSTTCRKCGEDERTARPSRDTFHCRSCEYEVHADVNAAANIAMRREE